MGFADDFFRRVDLARQPTLALAATMDVRFCMKSWLLMLYQVIRGTGPTLNHAIAFCADPGTPFEEKLFAFFRLKEEEEPGHADLFLADIYRAGFTQADVAAAPLNPFAVELVGRQFYLIELVHPSAYLGYIGLLEGFAPTLDEVDSLASASGLVDGAFSTARLHAKADVVHRAELAQVLDSVPEIHQAAITENGVRCAHLQQLALEHLNRNIRWDH